MLAVRMYASLITAHGRARRPQQALQAFAAAKAAGLAPDATLYNAAMKAAARSKRWAQVARLFEELEARPHLRPDYVSYNTAIQALGHLGRWQCALALYRDMKSQVQTTRPYCHPLLLSPPSTVTLRVATVKSQAPPPRRAAPGSPFFGRSPAEAEIGEQFEIAASSGRKEPNPTPRW